MPGQQLARLQGSQTSTAHRDDPQEALQERGSDVLLDLLWQNNPEGESITSSLQYSEEETQALG